jgi:gamma-glutamylcyclotransferase (GGCT)/AIG2-like uncharacterized protein YtfP
MTKIAVYGTLRKGYGLNGLLEKADYVDTVKIQGYRMYTFSGERYSYPIVSYSGRNEDEIEVELYDVHDNGDFKSIDSIELGAGYHHGEIEVKGERYLIYLQDESRCNGRLHRVESGNFNEFANMVRELSRIRE